MDYSKEDNSKKIKKHKSANKKVKNKAGLLVFRILIVTVFIAGFAVLGASLGAYIAIIKDTPTDFELLPIESLNYTTIIYDNQTGIETGRFSGAENREYVELKNISKDLKNAYIAIEDERFYSHNGIDVRGIFRSLYYIFFKNTQQGASTITQQVIKNNITNVTRNDIKSKLREQYLAIKYEEFLEEELGSKNAAKDYILQIYINSIPMGHGLFGVQTASNFYFAKDPADLTLAESASLAAITNRPGKYSPDDNPEQNKTRQGYVLQNMERLDYITEAQHKQALNEDIYSRVGIAAAIIEETPSIHTFYEDQIFESLLQDLNDMGYDNSTASMYIYNGGLQIYSVQDMEIQKIVDEGFNDDSLFPARDFELDVEYILSVQNTVTGKTTNLEKKKTVKTEDEVEIFVESVKEENIGPNDIILGDKVRVIPQPQAAMAIIDQYTGHVKAIGGGRGEKLDDRSFNRATKATRSPGSVFKILSSFAPAIDLGLITPATVIDDAPFTAPTVDSYTPVNWYGGFKGYSTIRQGVTNSMNVVAVKNMFNTGIDNCFNYLLNFGFTTLVDEVDSRGNSDRGLSTALGGLTYGVTQVEVTAAYASIANGGMYNKPIYYTKVLDHDGNTIIDNTLEPTQVLKKTSAYLLTDMMKGVLTDTGATGGRARFKEVKMPIAGKTGTTSKTNDLTFVGYTPYYTAGVWLGFDQQKSIMGENWYHLALWSHIMEEIHRDLPYKDFERPEGIVSAQVCRHSGKLPVAGLCDHDPRGNAIHSEIFAAGTVPTDSCDIHASVEIDTSTGMRANPYCPSEAVETRYGIIRDSESAGKVGDSEYEVTFLVDSEEFCTVHDMFHTEIIDPEAPDDNSGIPPDLIDFLVSPTPTPNSQWPYGSDYNYFSTPTPTDNSQMPDGLMPTPTPAVGGGLEGVIPTPTPEFTPVPTYAP